MVSGLSSWDKTQPLSVFLKLTMYLRWGFFFFCYWEAYPVICLLILFAQDIFFLQIFRLTLWDGE